jgi:hypothetical protein
MKKSEGMDMLGNMNILSKHFRIKKGSSKE